MKAITIIPKTPNSMKILEVKKPSMKNDEVLVKIIRVGIDGTDKEIIRGDYGEAPKGSKYLIFGHESIGRIEKVGSKVTHFKIGDLVVASVRRPDDCINCKSGETDMCIEGNYKERGIKGMHGFLAEYYVEKPQFLTLIPKRLEKIGVLLEPLSVVEKGIRIGYEVQKRLIWNPKNALVTGSGTLGLLACLVLKSRGLNVIMYDRSDNKIKKGIYEKLKIKRFSSNNTNLHDVPKLVGKQIDLIFEATGNSSIAFHSMNILGTNGVLILTSLGGNKDKIEICTTCLNNGLVLGNKSIVGSVNANMIDFKKGVSDISFFNNKWPDLLDSLITSKMNYTNIEKALESLNENIDRKSTRLNSSHT